MNVGDLKSANDLYESVRSIEGVTGVHLFRIRDAGILKSTMIPELDALTTISLDELNKSPTVFTKNLLQGCRGTDLDVPAELKRLVIFVCNILESCNEFTDLGSARLLRLTFDSCQLVIMYGMLNAQILFYFIF